MNAIRKILMTSILLIVGQIVIAAEPTAHYVKSKALNVRSAPINGDVIGRLTRGQEVKGYARDGEWLRISESEQSQQWVSIRHLCDEFGCWLADQSLTLSPSYSTSARRRNYRASSAPRSQVGVTQFNSGSDCPCSGTANCYGRRGGRYCITSGGNKRYR